MATRAYILVETAVGKTRDVVAALKGLEGVKSVDPVIGPFDVVAVVEAKDHTAVGELVTSRFHRIPRGHPHRELSGYLGSGPQQSAPPILRSGQLRARRISCFRLLYPGSGI